MTLVLGLHSATLGTLGDPVSETLRTTRVKAFVHNLDEGGPEIFVAITAVALVFTVLDGS